MEDNVESSVRIKKVKSKTSTIKMLLATKTVNQRNWQSVNLHKRLSPLFPCALSLYAVKNQDIFYSIIQNGLFYSTRINNKISNLLLCFHKHFFFFTLLEYRLIFPFANCWLSSSWSCGFPLEAEGDLDITWQLCESGTPRVGPGARRCKVEDQDRAPSSP